MSETVAVQSPVREYRTVVLDSGSASYVNRLMIATPTRGTVRMEWAGARYGQTVPVNWSHVQLLQFYQTLCNPFLTVRFGVADAQNLIVREVVDKDFEWLLLIEDDVVLPIDALVRFNEYIRAESTPVVSGLYYTKSRPAEPLVFRGRGTSFYGDWELGDLVWCDGVPTGCLLIHAGLLREMWEDAPEYQVGYGGRPVTRRVFKNPEVNWQSPELQATVGITGTSDLQWCTEVMKGDYLRRAGWGKFADEHPEFPFLVDTRIFCRHIDPDGIQYP